MRNIGFTVMMGSEKPCSGSWGGDESRASFVPMQLAKWTFSELLKPD